MSLDLRSKTVTVIGAARSGQAVAKTVQARGGKAKISEYKTKEAMGPLLGDMSWVKDVPIEWGGHTKEFIVQSDLVVLSPGVRQDIDPVRWAREAGIEVMGEIEFAYRLCPCPIVAVTGSNGKTTTATLIAQVLQAAGRRVCLCGNIGSPFSQHVLGLTPEHTVVLEVSSFQLESTRTFKPHIAVWLNFSQNHLDRHKDMEEYFQAKAMLLQNQGRQDVAILNSFCPQMVDLSKTIAARVVFFNEAANSQQRNPNEQAVVATALALGIPESVCDEVFAAFHGVEHRQEFVRTLNGVDYVNDSKSTTPEAGRYALEGARKPLVMICGGSDKHLEFVSLRDLVKEKVKHLIVFGQTKELLRKTFHGIVPIEVCDSLEDAVMFAKRCANPGDQVILSPMCASFDMFQNFEHRGRVFKTIVLGLRPDEE